MTFQYDIISGAVLDVLRTVHLGMAKDLCPAMPSVPQSAASSHFSTDGDQSNGCNLRILDSVEDPRPIT